MSVVRLLESVQRHSDICRVCVELRSDELRDRKSQQVGRRRLNANLRDHDSMAVLCHTLVLFDHSGHEGYLAGYIEIMGSALGTSLESKLSVGAIWPDSGDEQVAFLRQLDQLDAVELANLDIYSRDIVRASACRLTVRKVELTWRTTIGVDLFEFAEQGLEFGPGTSCHCPS
jgi:hypothetical protein